MSLAPPPPARVVADLDKIIVPIVPVSKADRLQRAAIESVAAVDALDCKHSYRGVVPGNAGARSVRDVDRAIVDDE